jgi:hypothetical protein
METGSEFRGDSGLDAVRSSSVVRPEARME